METERNKFPKIAHLPWSQTISVDDIIQTGLQHLRSCKEILVTEKMDGEKTDCYWNGIHTRSLDGEDHPSRHIIKQIQAEKLYNMPKNMKICGENIYAKRSIFYDKLPSYFLVFAIFLDDICLSWDATMALCNSYRLDTVPVLYRGPYDEDLIKSCWTGISKFGPEQEGYVIRNVDGFFIDEFNQNILKYIRPNHIKANKPWLSQPIVPNKLNV